MTIQEIAAALTAMGKEEVAQILEAVYQKHKDIVLQQMEYWHQIGSVLECEYEAYCYLWRNLVPRFGIDLNQFDLRKS